MYRTVTRNAYGNRAKLWNGQLFKTKQSLLSNALNATQLPQLLKLSEPQGGSENQLLLLHGHKQKRYKLEGSNSLLKHNACV